MNERNVDLFARGRFDIKLEKGAVTSLKYARDIFDTEYILKNKRFGDIFLSHRKQGGNWIRTSTLKLSQNGLDRISYDRDNWRYEAKFPAEGGDTTDIWISVSYKLDGGAMYYTINLVNNCDSEVEIGDLAIPFPMNSSFEWGTKPYESVIRHSFVSGHGSHIFWMRCNSVFAISP